MRRITLVSTSLSLLLLLGGVAIASAATADKPGDSKVKTLRATI